MTVYGYARISRKEQSIDRQIRNILSYNPKARIYQEAFTGTKMNRPEWNKLVKTVKTGDTIIFDSVSRMSRDAEEGIKQYFELFDRGISLVFLKEQYINTGKYQDALNRKIDISISTGKESTDKYFNGQIKLMEELLRDIQKEDIIIAFEQAQKEVDDLHQRTKEGIETARQNGKQIGQKLGKKLVTKKSIEAKEIIRKHSIEFGGSLNDEECMKQCGLSRNTFYKYKRELRAEQQ